MTRSKPFTFQGMTQTLRNQQLDIEDLRRYAPSGRAIEFTPSFTGNTVGTDPTYTLDAAAAGFYVVANNLLFCNMIFLFTALTAGTSPQWQFSLPPGLDMGSTLGPVGMWHTFDASGANNICKGQAMAGAATSTVVYLEYASPAPIGPSVSVGATTPWAWAKEDSIYITLTCRVIDGFNP